MTSPWSARSGLENLRRFLASSVALPPHFAVAMRITMDALSEAVSQLRRPLGGALLLATSCGPMLEAHSASESPPPSEPVVWSSGGLQSLRIPGGATCLSWLPRLGIEYRSLEPIPAVATPVEVRSPIGGISYKSLGQESVVADCRLILALDWIGPSLREFGIREVQHSGAYVNRAQKSGRPSLHARGLAIDLHGFTDGEERVEVERDFARGIGDGCDGGAPEINRVVCRLRALDLFQELLTPDHDADHHDHVHLAIAPRSG
jgi:hypothetical protein